MAKPAILAVDDDPEVLGAVERDLRRRYRADYRIVRAGSGREALEAADELQKRGIAIALFLVDQRMPGMTGTELLQRLRPTHPDAKKVLLTAYADTDAAIASINDVGLDHYLLKPWDPPEQRLYPVLDDLLSDWTAHVRLPFDGIRVAGARWSRDCYLVRDFLSRNRVPYQWIDIEQDAPTRELVERVAGSTTPVPVIFFPDGTHLVRPGMRELAAKLGLGTQANLPFYDLVIIGAGPAGLAGAVYGASEGLRTLIVEQNAPGGQAGTSSRIENYLGFPSGISGDDLAHRAITQARRFGAEMLTGQDVVGIRREDPYRYVRLSDGSEVPCFAALIATGMEVRMLDVPGLDELVGAGVYYGTAMTEAAMYRGQDVFVVGGANSAGQGALFFSRYARTVTMLVRASGLEKSMSQYLIDRIKATSNIQLRTGVEVARAEGQSHLERITLRRVSTGDEEALPAAALFIFIGSAPRSGLAADLLARDDKGFLLVGPDVPREGACRWPLDRDPFLFETNVPGVFAVGDVRAGTNRRVATAVGEGSAAVHSIHRYLETV
jgi:thioredoxin reductase (NADPH)